MQERDVYKKDISRIRKHFAVSASTYTDSAYLQKEVGDRLLEKLELMDISPDIVVDLGCGPRIQGQRLMDVFGKSSLVEVDLAFEMLKARRIKKPLLFNRRWPVCANAEALPLMANSIGMIYSNLMFQWCNNLDLTFSECHRTLRPEGLLIFSSFGPDTLKELRTCWAEVDDKVHVNAFIDMHDVGDALMRCGFDGPVMETEYITLTYDSLYGLMRDLKNIGAQNANEGRSKALTGKGAVQKLARNYEQYRVNDKLPATYEVVYGHAWRSGDDHGHRTTSGEVRVPVEHLKKRIGT